MPYREYCPPEEYAEILKIPLDKFPGEGGIVADNVGGAYRINKTAITAASSDFSGSPTGMQKSIVDEREDERK